MGGRKRMGAPGRKGAVGRSGSPSPELRPPSGAREGGSGERRHPAGKLPAGCGTFARGPAGLASVRARRPCSSPHDTPPPARPGHPAVLTQDTTRRMVCGCRTRVWGSKAPPALPAPYAPPSIVAAPARCPPLGARRRPCACAAPPPPPRLARPAWSRAPARGRRARRAPGRGRAVGRARSFAGARVLRTGRRASVVTSLRSPSRGRRGLPQIQDVPAPGRPLYPAVLSPSQSRGA